MGHCGHVSNPVDSCRGHTHANCMVLGYHRHSRAVQLARPHSRCQHHRHRHILSELHARSGELRGQGRCHPGHGRVGRRYAVPGMQSHRICYAPTCLTFFLVRSSKFRQRRKQHGRRRMQQSDTRLPGRVDEREPDQRQRLELRQFVSCTIRISIGISIIDWFRGSSILFCSWRCRCDTRRRSHGRSWCDGGRPCLVRARMSRKCIVCKRRMRAGMRAVIARESLCIHTECINEQCCHD